MYGANSINMQADYLSHNKAIPKIDTNANDSALREQTDAFEAIIIKMLMDKASENEKNLFSEQGDPGDKIYKSMYRDELSKASAGGFGFSQMLFDFLSRN